MSEALELVNRIVQDPGEDLFNSGAPKPGDVPDIVIDTATELRQVGINLERSKDGSYLIFGPGEEELGAIRVFDPGTQFEIADILLTSPEGNQISDEFETEGRDKASLQAIRELRANAVDGIEGLRRFAAFEFRPERGFAPPTAPQFPDPLRGVSFLPLEQVPRLEFVGSARDVKTEKKVFDALKPTLGINFKRFGVDLTFSKGISHRRFGLGEPTHKFDLYPQQKGVVKADVRDGTGLPSSSQFSVFFDPPFMVRKAATGGSREAKRFSAFDTREEAFEVWGAGVKEAARLLAPNGQFMVKIQDTKPSTGKNRSRMAATKFIVNTATESGMKLVDRVDKIDPDAFQPAGTAKRQARVSYLIFEKLGE
jgi:hypothetical protein